MSYHEKWVKGGGYILSENYKNDSKSKNVL